MAGGRLTPLSAANFPDPREVNIEVGESSSRRPPRPRPRRRPLPPPSPILSLSLDMAVEYELKHGGLDPNMETKKLRRIVSNRLAAQRSRVRRSRRVIDLEAMTHDLEDLVRNLTPQVESLQRSTLLLQEEYESLQARSKFHEDQLIISERATDELEAEIVRLKAEFENLNMNQQMQNLQLDVVDEDEQVGALVEQFLNFDDEFMMNLDFQPGL